MSQYGNVHYADEIQAIVKWDDGSSSNLRLDRDKIQVIARAPERVRAAAELGDSALAINA